MKQFSIPPRYRHTHPPIKNVNDLMIERLTVGQKAADRVAKLVGSWHFIIIQSLMITVWITFNVIAYVLHWDPYPFILLNLFLSLQAAYTAPILMMSQNRLSEMDRIEAHNDYHVNVKSEEEIRAVLDHLSAQNEILLELLNRVPDGNRNV